MYCKICKAENDNNSTYCVDCEAKLGSRHKFIDSYGGNLDGPPAKSHHLFMSLCLVFIIVSTSIKAISFIPTSLDVPLHETDSSVVWNPWTHWSTGVSLVLSIVLIIFAIAVWKWKRWGILGFLATAVISLVVDIVSKPSIMTTYYWFFPYSTQAVVVFVVLIYVAITGPFLIGLWLDKSSGWGRSE
jgi:hypothetical protein